MLQAERRFGFGPSGGQPYPADGQAWLRQQLDVPDPLLERTGPTSANGILVQRGAYQERAQSGMTTYGSADLYRDDMAALLNNAVATSLPFRERLVWFWANHFTASAKAGGYTLALAGAFVREAIRPHVTGRFTDMLKAVMQHPDMLFYLDNWTSTGPDSPEGMKLRRGLNENLARECLELHTMGINSGYTQADVTMFAAILSGRTANFDSDTPGFLFKASMHQPGPKTMLGRTFPAGFEGSEQALDFIGTHPATYRHLAHKLVRHFIADEPPPHCVDTVTAVLHQTDGALKPAVLALVDMPEAWVPLTKFRSPAEYVVALQRALNLPPPARGAGPFEAALNIGQPFMSPLLPNGWPDTAADWISGEALLKRADYAMTQALRPGAPDAQAVLAATISDVCSPATRAAVAACPNNAEALATVLASPEFMRR
ncbi:MAG: DUF1800 domain-containing protein [Acetobacteraceae bacterium]